MRATAESAPPIRGLTEQEVQKQRAAGLVNHVPTTSSRSVADILRTNLFTLFNAILVVAMAGLLAMGLVRDAIVTGGLVLFTVGVSTVQELIAKRRLDKLALLNRAKVRVIRDGEERSIDPGEVVQGDYLALGRGDQIVADGHLVFAERLEIDESLLTGEAAPEHKRPGDPVLSGSFCVAGSGVYVAEKIAEESYVQKLTAEGRRYRNPRTPLQRMLDRVLRVLLAVVIGLSLLQFVGFELRNVPVVEAVRATAVMFTLVPQGLLLMSTLAYSLGALRVADKGALVQQLNAVESLSHVDTLCLDKTGTLTRGELALRDVTSLEPGGSEGSAAKIRALVGRYAASVTDPTESIAALARAIPASPAPVTSAVAFSSERKWSAQTFAAADSAAQDAQGTFVLGAPEALLPHLVSSADTANLAGAVARHEAAGERVLLFAEVPPDRALATVDGVPSLPDGLRALALLTLEEELRPDAQATLSAFAAQGVALKLISGDSPQTVLALARRAGFLQDAVAISGPELAEVPDDQFAAVVERTTVFGRVTPQQKREIIRTLKAQGHYVAMVGDGANDVLALKEANLGIAMGSGSAAARAVADVVLLQDSFAALPSALSAGRQIVNGMRQAIRLFLVRDVATLELIVASNFVGAPFPLLPPHSAILAFLTVGLPAFVVVGWAKPDRRPDSLREDAGFVLWVGSAYALSVLTIYVVALAGLGVDVTQARTGVVTTAMLCGLLTVLLAGHPLDAPVREYLDDRRTLALVGGLLAAYLGVLYVPGLHTYFELAALAPLEWLYSVPPVVFWFGALRLQVKYHIAERLLDIGDGPEATGTSVGTAESAEALSLS